MNTQKYDFHFSDKCAELHAEAGQMIKSGDACAELILDWIADLDTAKNDFNKSLPWWYKVRHSNFFMVDGETYKEACREYNNNIFEKSF